ncbi:MAG: peroxiredoxin [Pseudomonadota bacterium]
MTIGVGDKIPSVKVMTVTDGNPDETTTHDLMGSGKIALFSVPGAFTPTCSARHLPGFVDQANALKAKGIDKIVCMSVNDAFVMKAWSDAHHAGDAVAVLADGNGDFADALGLTMDASGFGMGKRAQRFSAILDNGTVTHLNVEEGGAFDVSSADYMLGQL